MRNGKSLEAFVEGGEVLAGEQRRRHHHGHLKPGAGSDERGAQRDLRLAEAHVAAHQPVHGLARGQVLQHRMDAGSLVVGLLVGKAGDELVKLALRRCQRRRLSQLAQCGDLDELGGNLADALLEASFARLPADAAEPIELGHPVARAIARQQLDVLDRQVELVAAGVADLEAIVRSAERRNGGEPIEAADAVVGVHDEVADGEAGRLGDEVGGAARLAARAHQPVAEDVLLADDSEVGCVEALLHAEHRKADVALAERLGLGVAVDLARVGEAVLGKQGMEPFARARRKGRDQHALALALQAANVGDGRVEDIGALARSLGREVAPCAAAERLHGALGIARLLEGGEVADRAAGEQGAPFLLAQVHGLGRHRLIRRGSEALGLQPIDAGLVVIADQG